MERAREGGGMVRRREEWIGDEREGERDGEGEVAGEGGRERGKGVRGQKDKRKQGWVRGRE